MKRGERVVRGDKEPIGKLGRNDLVRAARDAGFKACCLTARTATTTDGERP